MFGYSATSPFDLCSGKGKTGCVGVRARVIFFLVLLWITDNFVSSKLCHCNLPRSCSFCVVSPSFCCW